MALDVETLSSQVDELVAREEIRTVLYNYCRAVDRGDRGLFLSLFHEDAIDHHGNYVGPVEGLWDTIERAFDVGLAPLDRGRVVSMAHSLGNIIIERRGDLAHVESYLTGVNIFEAHGGEEYYSVMNARYSDRFEKRDRTWKIAERRLIKDFRDVRPVTSNPRELYEMGRRDRSDAGYPPLGW
jgi:hypothetical protein